MREIHRHVRFEVFESSFKSWKSLFAEAATFTESVGPERLIGISHSEDERNGVVTAWYLSHEPRGAE
jgi:hypothetical protein